VRSKTAPFKVLEWLCFR